MTTLVIFFAVHCLILMIYYERILLYKVRKLLTDVNMCACFKVQMKTRCLLLCLRKYYFKDLIIPIISLVPWDHVHTD